LTDAIEKHNRRNPDDPVVYIDYSNGDPDLTNDKCSYWHFGMGANVDMELEVLTADIANDNTVKSVFLINQDYSTGHQVSRLVKEKLAEKRPDIEIVGDILHPMGRVRDFAPYAAEIRKANPDVVVTSNWGNDFGLLARASQDAGVDAKFFGLYAGATGGPSAIRDGWDGRVLTVSTWNPNTDDFTGKEYIQAASKRYPDDDLYYYHSDVYIAVKFLATAIREVDSIEVKDFVPVMPSLTFTGMNGDKLQMRVADHQLQLPMWSVVWKSVENDAVDVEQDGTGHGWLAQAKYSVSESTTPTTCDMKRP